MTMRNKSSSSSVLLFLCILAVLFINHGSLAHDQLQQENYDDSEQSNIEWIPPWARLGNRFNPWIHPWIFPHRPFPWPRPGINFPWPRPPPANSQPSPAPSPSPSSSPTSSLTGHVDPDAAAKATSALSSLLSSTELNNLHPWLQEWLKDLHQRLSDPSKPFPTLPRLKPFIHPSPKTPPVPAHPPTAPAHKP